MNNATRYGLSTHVDLELFEALVQRFQRPFWGMTEREAIRQALYIVYRTHDIPHDRARDDSAEIAALWPQSSKVSA